MAKCQKFQTTSIIFSNVLCTTFSKDPVEGSVVLASKRALKGQGQVVLSGALAVPLLFSVLCLCIMHVL